MHPIIIGLLIIALSTMGVVADYFLRLAGNGPEYISWVPFAKGFLIYASTALGWFVVLKHVTFAQLGVYYCVTTVLLLAIAGSLFFGEKLEVRDIIGIGCAVMSLGLLARFI